MKKMLAVLLIATTLMSTAGYAVWRPWHPPSDSYPQCSPWFLATCQSSSCYPDQNSNQECRICYTGFLQRHIECRSITPVCVPDLVCGAWSDCIDGLHSRDCDDGCGNSYTDTHSCIPSIQIQPVVMTPAYTTGPFYGKNGLVWTCSSCNYVLPGYLCKEDRQCVPGYKCIRDNPTDNMGKCLKP